MSRIGKQPISVPAGVKVELDGQNITVTGKKGTLKREIVADIAIDIEDNVITVNNRIENRRVNAFKGLTRTLISNMIVGVEEGFKKVLVIEGVGYKANTEGTKKLVLNVGYSNPVEYELPESVQATVDGQTKITLESIDKEVVGLAASQIRAIRKPEPYKGKGIRYENEQIVRKVGKAGGKK